MDKGSHPLKGAGFRATLKPDLEPDKAASKTPLLTFSRRLLTTSFSPRPWPVLRHRTVDRVQQLEKTSRATFALGDVSFLRGSALWLETPFPSLPWWWEMFRFWWNREMQGSAPSAGTAGSSSSGLRHLLAEPQSLGLNGPRSRFTGLSGRLTDTVCSWHLSSWGAWYMLPSQQ